MSLRMMFDEIGLGFWSDPHEAKCACRGTGWFLSDLDTWHACPQHHHGQPHPDDEDISEEEMSELNGLRADEAFWTFYLALAKPSVAGG